MSNKSGSNLERVLSEGRFAVTVEIDPPCGPSPEALIKKAEAVKGIADAYNVSDNIMAVVRMSSIAASKLLLDAGLEPVMQMTCRDRNRIAMQSDLLGAYALGLRNCLCLSGDHQSLGGSEAVHGHPESKNVYDVDSTHLLQIAKGLGDNSTLLSGDAIDAPANFFIGAVWSPLATPVEFRTIRLAKKLAAGAAFVQTPAVFDVEGFKAAMKRAEDAGHTESIAILPGIALVDSAKALQHMHDHVPGVTVPQEIMERMAAAADPLEEGYKIAVELINAVQQISGIRGVHLQAPDAEERLPELVKRAGLQARE